MSNSFEVEGLVGGDPELRYSGEGLAIVTFNVADTPRKFNQDTKQWEDAGETAWFRVSAFGSQAETIAGQIKKGSPVLVKGTLTFRGWETKEGEKRESKELKADKVYVALRGAKGGSGASATTKAPVVAENDEDSPF
jgi:single-strand DNA-binding protein